MAEGFALPGGARERDREQEVRTYPRGPVDVTLIFVTFALIGLGLLAIYNGSALKTYLLGNDDAAHYLKQQLFAVGLGFTFMLVAVRFDYRWYKKLGYPFLGVACLLLLLTTSLSPIAVTVNGATRWFAIGPVSFQPAEFAKVAAVFFMAYSLDRKGRDVTRVVESFVAHLLLFAPVAVLLMSQPDFGSTMIIAAVVLIMLVLGGANSRITAGAVAVVGALAAFMIWVEEYRRERVLAWLDPWEYADSIGYHLVNSYVALAHGGMFGTGFGEGRASLGYIPELYNDFIAASIGEEFGFVGMVVLVSLYVVFAWRGLVIADRAPDSFGRFLALGITLLISIQAVFNLCVVTGVVPTKGLTLPFVSYGKSSLVVLMPAVGVLLNISQRNVDVAALRRAEKQKVREAVERAEKLRRAEARRRREREKQARRDA